MGGGGGSTPAPKTFTPPPLQDGPATNPIPNFFSKAGAESRVNPFAALAQIQQTPAQNPFGQPGQMNAQAIEALLRRIRGMD
jgi:hypothetical protein